MTTIKRLVTISAATALYTTSIFAMGFGGLDTSNIKSTYTKSMKTSKKVTVSTPKPGKVLSARPTRDSKSSSAMTGAVMTSGVVSLQLIKKESSIGGVFDQIDKNEARAIDSIQRSDRGGINKIGVYKNSDVATELVISQPKAAPQQQTQSTPTRRSSTPIVGNTPVRRSNPTRQQPSTPVKTPAKKYGVVFTGGYYGYKSSHYRFGFFGKGNSIDFISEGSNKRQPTISLSFSKATGKISIGSSKYSYGGALFPSRYFSNSSNGVCVKAKAKYGNYGTDMSCLYIDNINKKIKTTGMFSSTGNKICYTEYIGYFNFYTRTAEFKKTSAYEKTTCFNYRWN